MTNNELQALIREITGIVGSNDLFKTAPSDLSYGQSTTAWSALKLLKERMIDPRMDVLRLRLFTEAERRGEKNENGTFVFEMPNIGATVQKIRKEGKATFSTDDVTKVLSEKLDVLKAVLTTTVKISQENYKRLIAVIRYAEMQAEKEGNTRVLNAVAKIRTAIGDNPKYTVDTKALNGMRSMGKVTDTEMSESAVPGKVNWALKVDPPKDVEDLFPSAPKKKKKGSK